jgi:cell wall-associated NlpC family hydrolase
MLTKAQIEALITEAKTWLKTPYHAHACIKKAGVDCAQLLIGVVIGAGIASPFEIRKDYSVVVPQGSEYTDIILQYCDEITEQEVQSGDLALYKTSHGWMHSAIVIEWPNSVIHATEKRGVIMTSGNEDILRGKPRRFFRFRGGN